MPGRSGVAHSWLCTLATEVFLYDCYYCHNHSLFFITVTEVLHSRLLDRLLGIMHKMVERCTQNSSL